MPCPEKVTVKTYLTPEEYELLKKMAQYAKLSVSAYIKALCLGHEVKSKEDKTAILELAKISADLGRLGGLFKLALSEKNQLTNSGATAFWMIFSEPADYWKLPLCHLSGQVPEYKLTKFGALLNQASQA